MNDSDLIILFSGILESAIKTLSSQGVQGVEVFQLLQPTQQGRKNSGNGVYFQFLFTRNYGSPQKTKTYNSETEVFDYVQTQQMVTKIQISVFYPADPNVEDRISAHDLAVNLAMRMQSDKTIMALRAAGVGISRITEVRNPNFDNDQDQSEFVPNFDLDLNYNRVINDTVDRIVEITGKTIGVK